MDTSGNVMTESADSSSESSTSDNVEVMSESAPSGLSLKGETIDVGDVSVRKEDLILGLLVLNLGMMMYD